MSVQDHPEFHDLVRVDRFPVEEWHRHLGRLKWAIVRRSDQEVACFVEDEIAGIAVCHSIHRDRGVIPEKG